MMLRACVLALCLMAAAPAAGLAQAGDAPSPVALRAQPQADPGTAIMLSDLFDGVPILLDRAVAPSPRSGQTVALSPLFVANLARSAGLYWDAPAGLQAIRVGARGSAPVAATASPAAPFERPVPAVRRNETVTVRVERPGVSLTLRGTAMGDAALGTMVKIRNPVSGKVLDAVVTGPGEARIGTPATPVQSAALPQERTP